MRSRSVLSVLAVLTLTGSPQAVAGVRAPLGPTDVATSETRAAAIEVALAEAAATSDGQMPHQIDRGEGLLPLFVPRDEELTFRVDVAWGVVGAALGTVTLSAGVEDYHPSLLVKPADPKPAPAGTNGDHDEPRVTGWMKARAFGEHLFYTMDATLESRHQPQEWPRIVYRSTQEGSEQRRRELLIGIKEGSSVASYRRDTSKGAPKGTRIWKEPDFRDVPEDTLDMTSAVYLVRTFIMRGLRETTVPILQKRKLWLIKLSTGQTLVQDTPAGRFEAVEVILEAQRHPDDEVEEEDRKKFRSPWTSTSSCPSSAARRAPSRRSRSSGTDAAARGSRAS
jgi:hypothetical protein